MIRSAAPRALRFILAAALLGVAAPAARAQAIEVAAQVGHSTQPRALALSAQGDWLASGDVLGRLILWDVASAREIWSLALPGARISALAFSADGAQLAVGDYDGGVRILHTESKREVARLEGAEPVSALAFRGEALLAYHRSRIAAWSTATWTRQGERALPLPATHVQRSRFSADGRHLLVSIEPARREEQRSVLVDTADGAAVLEVPSAYADLGQGAAGPFVVAREGSRLLVHEPGKAAPAVLLDDARFVLAGTAVPLASASGRFVMVDALAGTLAIELPAGAPRVVSLHRGPADGLTPPVLAGARHAAYGAASGAVRVFDAVAARATSFGGTTSRVLAAGFSADGGRLVALNGPAWGDWSSGGGRWSELDLERWSVEAVTRVPPGPLDHAALLHQRAGEWIAGIGYTAPHFLAGAALHAEPQALRPPQPPPPQGWTVLECPAAVSADGRLGAAARTNGAIYLWDLGARRLLHELREHQNPKSTWDFGAGCPIVQLALSPDARLLAVASRQDLTLELRDTASGRRIAAVEPPGREQAGFLAGIGFRALAFSPDGRLLAAASDTRLALYALPGLRPVRDFGPGSGARRVAFSPDGRLLAAADAAHRIRLWQLAAPGAPRVLAGHGDRVTSLAFARARPLLVSTSEDGSTRFWSAERGEELARLVVFNDGEWVLVTPEGYFSASRRGAEQLVFRAGLQLYRLNQFYDVFYRPDLVQAKLNGEDIRPLVRLTIAEALRVPPPETALALAAPPSAERAVLRYRVRSSGGGVGDVRVYLNGKLVRADAPAPPAAEPAATEALEKLSPEAVRAQLRALVVAAQSAPARRISAKPDLVEEEVEVEPVDGDNELSVVAFNRENTIQGETRSLAFRVTRAEPPPALHVLAIGINEYRAPQAALARAVDDARAFAALVAQAGGAWFDPSRISVTRLLDGAATRAAIVERLEELAKTVRPQDTLVVFAAAHGVLHRGQYALVTHDYAGQLDAAHLLSADELLQASRRVRALDQVFILDTCHAGGLNTSLAAYYDSRLTLLARNSGIHVLAGASDRQGALDDHQGNGLFTHVLLRGMRAREADANADGQVSVVELGRYAAAHVRRIAGERRIRQSPVILHFGRDRPLNRL